MVERFGCYGGNITVVGVEGLAWYRHEATIEANGIGREFEDRAKAMGAAVPESQSLIPTCTDQHSCAHLRIPMDLMRAGWPISLFQASQQ